MIDYRAQEEALHCLEALADCDLSRTETKRLYDGSLIVTYPSLSQRLVHLITTTGRVERA